jgi:DNA-binding response OmpR family regulator
VTRVFKDLGVEVDHCLDRNAAIHKLAGKKFDAIVADDCVAGASQLLEAARDLPSCNKSVRILLADAPTTIGDAFQLGTQIVLYKPLSAERIRHGLRAVRNLMTRERRQGVHRVRVEIPATAAFKRSSSTSVTIIDLSSSGAARRSPGPLRAAGHFSLEFELPETRDAIKATAEVVWQDTRGVSGIRFIDVAAQSRRKLVDWLRTYVESKTERV